MTEEVKEVVPAVSTVPAALAEAGVTQDLINEWKAKFGKIQMAKVAGLTFVYRVLRRIEAKSMPTGKGDEILADWLLPKTILFPADFAQNLPTYPAGVPQTLTESIIRFSGYVLDDTPVEL